MSTRTFKINGMSIEVNFTDDPLSGAMKNVYLSTDGKYALAIFSNPDGSIKTNTGDDRRRLENLAQKKLTDEMKRTLCWPIAHGQTKPQNELAFVMPRIPQNFFCSFQQSGGKRTEKVIHELADPYFANVFFEKYSQSASFYGHLVLCRELAKAVGFLHDLGVIHTDLSENNVLADPFDKKVYIIDIDGCALNNSGFKLADVSTLGTPKYIAPEIMQNAYNRKEISFDASADLFPLAIHIYSLLLHRHPLNRVLTDEDKSKYNIEAVGEDNIIFGLLPAYIESDVVKNYIFSHDKHYRNRYMNSFRMSKEKFQCSEKTLRNPDWFDLNKFSAERICGPYLAGLFKQTFTDGLTDPRKRPSAKDWERAITKTIKLLYPCSCKHRAFVLTEKNNIHCPFCGKPVGFPIPVLYVYSYRISSNDFAKDRNGDKQESIIVGNPGRKIYRWQLLGDTVNSADRNSPLFQLIQHRNGEFSIYNLKLPDIQLVYMNSTGQNIHISQNQTHNLLDGMMFKLMVEGDLEIVMVCRFVK